ncbi:hypothetical protein OG206_27850 [Streptomyces sp. NBC_01341]|uniref:hypothetical protein n=1 Tax=Streptomyces sp. NBC_01341 TaxID=2903831 RepID=UPI002E1591DD|nr:hypothetical protein OG206_27850 [Streptomyces sp. NBC_01341]
MGTAIPIGISSQALAVVATASADPGSVASWVAAGAAVFGVGLSAVLGIKTSYNNKTDRVRTQVLALQEILDDCTDRVVAPADVTAIRRLRPTFRRLAKVNRKVPQIAAVEAAITEVADLPVPVATSERGRYEQRLGEAVGRLKDAAEAAFEVLSA